MHDDGAYDRKFCAVLHCAEKVCVTKVAEIFHIKFDQKVCAGADSLAAYTTAVAAAFSNFFHVVR